MKMEIEEGEEEKREKEKRIWTIQRKKGRRRRD